MAESPDMEETFVQLVVSHQAALHAFVVSLMPGTPDVDDVVQEVNAAVWRKRREFEIGTNFKAWMFSVARFKVLALWRDLKRKKVWTVPEATLVKLLDDAADQCFDAHDHRHDALRECVQQLRPEDRGLVLRYYYEGRSLGEVAAAIGRKAENLKGSLHRIRTNLRSCVRFKTQLGGNAT
ncbi:DNA-directed RNA polymerase sigma-70 factor [Haloferula helveola]|uniref:DNA-directed RNA polymerase sigma-70 factor n=1 Tax=Haloferula helveola TaxID=490095 RepID=A0ABN6H563_9BACT|nr:DNA-directed RNA polymerase sigma-70 factor [Haloferula helveola]